MSDAKLTLTFWSFNIILFDIFKINNKEYNTSKEQIEVYFLFNDLEKEIGKKVCTYELHNKYNTRPLIGTFEVYLGDNTGICFIDSIGLTLQFAFIKQNGKIEELIQKGFVISQEYSDKQIEFPVNKINTQDRANLLLINCHSEEIITIGNNNKIFVNNIFNKLLKPSNKNG